MVYKYNNINFEVRNSKKLDEYFSSRLKSINCNDKIIQNYIDYKDSKLVLCINNEKIIINKKLKDTDIYQIYNNYLSILGNSRESLYIHSAVISKNNKGILLIGNFGQGKTTLSCLAQEYGYEINSADHSLLVIKNNKLFLKQGSTYIKENGHTYNIPYENSVKEIEIEMIGLLYGLSDKGLLSYQKIDDKYVFKRLYSYCSWHFTTPLLTDYNIELFNSKNSITCFWNNLNMRDIDVYMLRGDNFEIIKFFDDYLKSKDKDLKFIDGLVNNNDSLIKQSVISDLHVHGVLGSSKNKYGLDDIKTINRYTEFKNYISKYVDCSTKDKYRDLIINSIKTEIEDGVKYLEISIDIRYYKFFSNIEEYINDLRKIKDMFDINIKYDIGISKSTDTLQFGLIKDLIKTRFFCGIDLYGDEKLNDFDKFVEIYKLAKEYHLKRKVHVGEVLGSNNMYNVLVLEPNVIQHGIDIINCKDINKFKNISFNLCISSNIILGYVSNIKEHPIRYMYERGIKVTINTDDQLVFGKNIISEYKNLLINKIFNEEELDDIRKNGIY